MADARQRSEWAKVAGLVDGLVAVARGALAGQPVSASELIPERYRPPAAIEVPLTPEENRALLLDAIDLFRGVR